jgi:SRSO17 transposase
MYALGLLGDGERKSVEPIAARACGDPALCEAYQARLLHFIADSQWNDHGVRRAATKYALSAMVEREPIETWIVDDTGFLKQGKHSVGVQRQYTGSAGKITNCQVGVSLSVATRTEHIPIDFELYLPKSWANDPAQRAKGKIPDEVGFETKPELALDMIRWAVEDGVPRGVLLSDSGYGDSSAFREGVRELGLDYAVGIHGPTKVWRLDKRLRRSGEALSARDLALEIGRKGFRRTTWREGTKESLWSRFAMQRVVSAHDDGVDPAQREDVWLLMEWPDGEAEPTKYFLATLPRDITRKKLVRVVKERYRTERLYEDLKGELGLDHFEGRSFAGWHHHISVALCCYSFVVAERVRRFPPSARWSPQADALSLAA